MSGSENDEISGQIKRQLSEGLEDDHPSAKIQKMIFANPVRINKRESISKFTKFFKFENGDTGNEQIALCLVCQQQNLIKRIKRTDGNTSGLKRHLSSCHKDAYQEIFDNATNPAIKTASSSQRSFTEVYWRNFESMTGNDLQAEAPTEKLSFNANEKIDTQLINIFTQDYQPLSIVDEPGFREFVKALNPFYDLPNRHTISDTIIPELYETCLNGSKEVAKTITSACLTTECWTSVNNDNFLAVTTHFIDDNFQMKSMLLSCTLLDQEQTSLNLGIQLNEITTEWDLTTKIILAVSDNSPNIRAAITNEMGWNHFGCFAHSLNLIVQDALKLVVTPIDKVKLIVSHINRSPNFSNKLILYQENCGLSGPKKLIQDVNKQWNSTFYMLERFIELEDAVQSTVALLDITCSQLTSEEWIFLKELVKVLSPFENATRTVSGDNYMTASLVIVLTQGLLDVCTKLLECNFSDRCNIFIKKLESGLREWLGNVEYNNILALCTFLDPRFKTIPFENNDAIEDIRKLIINAVTELIDIAQTKPNVVKIEAMETVPNDRQSLTLWDTFDATVAICQPFTTANSRAVMEVQRYLEDELLNRNENPLQWWSVNKYNYPYLSTVVKENFCALATSVPYERFFSKTGNMLNDRRAHLSLQKVQQILFLNVNAQYSN